MRVIAALSEPSVVAKVLSHLDLPALPWPVRRRGPRTSLTRESSISTTTTASSALTPTGEPRLHRAQQGAVAPALRRFAAAAHRREEWRGAQACDGGEAALGGVYRFYRTGWTKRSLSYLPLMPGRCVRSPVRAVNKVGFGNGTSFLE
jgi:hypothetical protein